MINVNSFLSNNTTYSNINTEDSCLKYLIEGVRASSTLNNLSSILVDFDNHKPVYISDNLIYLEEASYCDFKRTCENPYWALVDDDTLSLLELIYRNYSKVKHEMTEEEYVNHICIMDYPITLRGRKFYIGSRFTPLAIHSDSVIQYGLFTFSPSSKKTLSFVIIASSGKRWTYDFGSNKFQEINTVLKLTLTEKAILQRAKKGMSNEEMAEDLFLSINTIKSHKMHIFKKLGVKSIAEALLEIGNYSLL